MIVMMKREVAAHLSKELRSQYKRRSLGVRKGDDIKVIRGKFSGKAGSVTDVDTKNGKVLVNGVTVKRTIGTEKQVPIEPSNIVITGLNLDDNARQKILLRKVKEVKVVKKEAPAPVPAEKEEEARQEAKPAAGHKHDGKDHAGHAHEHKAEAPRTKSAVAKSRVAAKPTRGGN